MPSPDLPHFNLDLSSDRRDAGRALAWIAGLVTLALVSGAIAFLALDRAVPRAPIVELRR